VPQGSWDRVPLLLMIRPVVGSSRIGQWHCNARTTSTAVLDAMAAMRGTMSHQAAKLQIAEFECELPHLPLPLEHEPSLAAEDGLT
jgi:hypothetical protein